MFGLFRKKNGNEEICEELTLEEIKENLHVLRKHTEEIKPGDCPSDVLHCQILNSLASKYIKMLAIGPPSKEEIAEKVTS